jgi:mono/diheme cytochrome c family protein
VKLIALALTAAALLAAPAAHAAPPGFENSMAQRTQACTVCHGREGRAGPDGYYPRIAGKPAGYLYNQLLNFRDGRRHYGLMTRMLEPLSDAYLLEMAQYFAALDAPYPPPAAQQPAPGADTLRRGRQLALQGDPARKLPACASCHGAALTGVQPATPGLLGLPRDYLNAQLGAWRAGQRRAHAPDCMAEVARRMDLADVNAVAAWLASQPVPLNSKPAASLPAPPELRCGNAPPATATAAAPPAPASPQANDLVVRGAYLARAGNCLACHTTQGGAPGAGGRGITTPFGTVYAGNITPDLKTGIGGWTSHDFWQALHHGKSKDGRRLYPAFPYTSYTQVTRADADALHAYLMSRPPVAQANTPHALRWPYSTQAALAMWRALYFSPGAFNADARQSAEWNRGAYLVRGLGHCAACHTTRNALGATDDKLDLAGGMIPSQNWYAPSLASPAEAGVADWPLADITQLLKTGSTARASMLGPMAEVVQHSTQHLSDADLLAMATYLKALPPAAVVAKATAPVEASVASRGAKLYEQQCAQCHGERGEGVAGAYPPLAGNRAVTLGHTANLVQIVLNGGFSPATAGNPRPYGMPPYVLVFSDADTAAVLSHIRNAWGNTAAPVTELDVSRQRSALRP